LCCASGEDKAITNSLHKDELLSHLTNLPIVLDYRTPETLGRDRIASAVGAWNEFKDHTVLKIDLGTCLTIDLVHNNALIGGLISPGLSMRLKAMNVYTAGLPLVEINEKVTFPGKSTEESMQVGVYQSVINEIVGYVNWANLRYDKVVIVDCSSYPIDFAKEVKNEIFARPKLVLQGLNNIIEYNAK
jgi:type III pantothenate kinase